MTQLRDDCFSLGDDRITLAEAEFLLQDRLHRVVEIETVPLAQADGRILAETVTAPHNIPPFDNSAVDGYALAYQDLVPGGETRLALAGRVTAGHPVLESTEPGVARRILTGAMIPAGLNTVVMQEDCRLSADGASVFVPDGVTGGVNVRRAGEDVIRGDPALRAGVRLRPPEVGLAAAMGQQELAVYRRLRVAVFSNGDELREPGGALGLGAIFDANRYMLRAILARLGCDIVDLGILPDDRDRISVAFDTAIASGAQVLIGSAGVSTGEEDHVRSIIESRGTLQFWRLAIKPGRPVAFGQINRVPVIGLPGNPVAMMITLIRLVRPGLLRLAGMVEDDAVTTPRFYRVQADFDYGKKPSRREWVRVRLRSGAGGVLLARRFRGEGSGLISSLVFADGLIELDEARTHLSVGEWVDFFSFSEVMA